MRSFALTAERKFWLVAAVVPALLAFVIYASVVEHDFYMAPGAPIHDAGWYAWIVWRQGIIPSNPPSASGFPSYWSIHVSLLVSVASIASYAFPFERIDYYALFQGFIYAPVALAPALVVGPPKVPSWKDTSLTAFTGVAFALNGQVLACAGYPHYEIFLSAGLCVMIAGLARGRMRTAWIGLAMAIATREDGGFHALLFIAVVLASDFVKRPFPIERRALYRMAAVAIVGSVVCMAVQKAFPSANLFREEYIGKPPLAHLSAGVLFHRIGLLFPKAAFIPLAFLSCVAVAIWKRDARYLLGWLAESPWFFLNLLAHQELKAEFSIYTGFPFVASMLWTTAYGWQARRFGGSVKAEDAESPRNRRTSLASLAIISAISILGMHLSYGWYLGWFARAVLIPSQNRAGLRAFADSLREDPRRYGKIMFDSGINSWAPERMPGDMRVFGWNNPRFDYDAWDGMAFFAEGYVGASWAEVLTETPYTSCSVLRGPPIYFCARRGIAFPPGFELGSPLGDALVPHPNARRVGGESFEIAATPGFEIAIHGPYARVKPGHYVATWTMKTLDCPSPTPGPPAHVDVFTRAEVPDYKDVVESGEVSIEFDATGDDLSYPIELRTFSGRCPIAQERVGLRHVR